MLLDKDILLEVAGAHEERCSNEQAYLVEELLTRLAEDGASDRWCGRIGLYVACSKGAEVSSIQIPAGGDAKGAGKDLFPIAIDQTGVGRIEGFALA
ncbi:hypothetical protein [Reticulibacter mediterranei]|uniref:hypothetical protein n=1 Tax=Reticulibacter mediterranei TaxID=2778369 RepID=UPI001C6912FD|nr:hypothetical protein [Reticulibacter mediterranei]